MVVNDSNNNNSANNPSNIFLRPEIHTVLDSDIAINTLLSKLKQSLLTCEDFTKYLRKKYILEQDHAEELSKGYKSFFQSSSNSLQSSIVELLNFDGKLANVRFSYVSALQKMYDELNALLLTMSKLRKNIKDKSRRLEKEVADAIHMAEKAKSKYDSLCQDWQKLKMSDPTKTKLTLRGSKTTKEQEEELRRKIDVADLDYKQRVDHSTSLRNSFINRERPKIVQDLKDLILEMDIAMSIQLQKYAIWTENMILNSGVTISPVGNSSSASKSMKGIASSVSSEYDLYNYLKKYSKDKNPANLINKNLIPVQYKKNPIMGGTAYKSGKGTFVVTSNSVGGGNNTTGNNDNNFSSSVPGKLNNSLPKRILSTSNESPFSSSTPITPSSYNSVSKLPSISSPSTINHGYSERPLARVDSVDSGVESTVSYTTLDPATTNNNSIKSPTTSMESTFPNKDRKSTRLNSSH
ncbi:uncharacterized protein SCODWIG_03241 [Saccharomycodes ludwigii]|uniref:F-BAR domain-containing protein n=1 Tax=Saccharomycodes ludwigii TaxID=36035 RepID=A0A376BBF7_9ASCO|nr:uncharacterized protein SCODWIG_03241 [Saccharomycodes ludwigii]